jgi:hypothetical protein
MKTAQNNENISFAKIGRIERIILEKCVQIYRCFTLVLMGCGTGRCREKVGYLE